MTRHSALLLGLWRLFGGHAAGQRPPVPPPPVVPVPDPDNGGSTGGNTGGDTGGSSSGGSTDGSSSGSSTGGSSSGGSTGGNTGGSTGGNTGGGTSTGVPADTPAQDGTPWIFAGLIVLGILAIMASQVLFKGGIHAVNIPNVPYFLAALVAVVALTLHIYSLRKWILPYLDPQGFPTTPFGDPTVTLGFYRTVWNFYTVAWLSTLVLLFFFAFGDIIPYVTNIVEILIIFWIGILVVIFVVTALSLGPDDSYIKTMIKAFQWVFVLILVILMYWGTKV